MALNIVKDEPRKSRRGRSMLSINKLNILYILIGLPIFLYVLLRAIYLPPDPDELFTFFKYVQTGSFQPFYAFLNANNHVLNSLFTYLSYLTFGDKMIALRLPNVLCFLLYLYFLFKLAKSFNSRIVGFSWFVTMIASLYLISFFSLSRGYGMSLAFVVASFYYLTTYHSSGRSIHLLAGLLFCSLGLWANLSIMIPVLLLGAVFIGLFVKRRFATQISRNIIVDVFAVVLLYVIPVIYATLYSFELKQAGKLYHGLDGDFFNGVVMQLVYDLSRPGIFGLVVFLILLAAYAISTISSFVDKRIRGLRIYFHVLFWGTIAGTILLHLFFDVKYPKDRAAIFFFVLFMVAFFFSLDLLNRKFPNYVALLVAMALLFQLVTGLTLSILPHEKSGTLPISFYQKLMRWRQDTGLLPTISASGLFSHVFNYYDYQNHATLNSAQATNDPSQIADFLITSQWVSSDLVVGYDTVQAVNETGVTLLQRQRFLEWERLSEIKFREISGSHEYMMISTLPADQFRLSPLSFNISFNVQSDQFPFLCWIVCNALDSAGNSLAYISLDMQRVIPDVRQSRSISRRQFIETIPKEAEELHFYFWNIKQQAINFSNVQLEVYRGQDIK